MVFTGLSGFLLTFKEILEMATPTNLNCFKSTDLLYQYTHYYSFESVFSFLFLPVEKSIQAVEDIFVYTKTAHILASEQNQKKNKSTCTSLF